MVNYYKILELSPTAKEDEIRKAINKELRNWSKRTNDARLERRQEAERIVKYLEEAEATLLDSSKRAQYDAQLRTAPTEERQFDDSDLAGKADLVQEGWQLLIEGNVADALYVATKATEKAADNPEAWALLAQAKFRWGELEDAIYEYRRAIKLKPNVASYYFDLGSVYETAERWNDALQQYQRASQIEPATTMYQAAIGILLLKNEKYKDSIEILERCRQQEPDNTTYQWFLAIAYTESTYEHWTFIPDGHETVSSGYYATEKAQVQEAEGLVNKAEALKFDDDELTAHIQSVKNNVQAMYARKFYGNWIVTGVYILLGFVMFGQGASGAAAGLFFLGSAGFYIFASRPPQYKLNRKIILGQSPTGGFDGIIWIILLYPIMAVWNFFRNYATE